MFICLCNAPPYLHIEIVDVAAVQPTATAGLLGHLQQGSQLRVLLLLLLLLLLLVLLLVVLLLLVLVVVLSGGDGGGLQQALGQLHAPLALKVEVGGVGRQELVDDELVLDGRDVVVQGRR